MTRAWLGRAGVLVGLAAVVTGCDGKGPAGPAPHPGINFERGASATDTAMGRPSQALVVRVRGEDGKPLSGLVVRFEGVAHAGSIQSFQDLEAFVGQMADREMGRFVTGTTDAQGRVQVAVQMGRVAGPARIIVTVPTLGIQDTARYTVVPASADRITLAPKDTLLAPFKSYTLRGGVVDRWGNRRDDALTFTGSAGVTVNANGVVSMTAIGRNFVVARAQGKVDTAWVNVFPTGTLAAYAKTGTTLGIVIAGLDGTDVRQIATSVYNPDYMATAWSPSGTEVVFHDGGQSGKRLYSVDMNGVVKRFIAPSPVTLHSEEWPQFTPDGQTVFFVGGTPQGAKLWRAAADGTEATLVGLPETARHDNAWHPSPSPDGRRLAYVATSDGARIRVFDSATGLVDSLEVPGNTPRWSPREDLIAYLHPGQTIMVMRPDGTGQRRVSRPGGGYDYGFNWSPDGEWLVAHHLGVRHLELIHVESGVTIPLPFTQGWTNPSWK